MAADLRQCRHRLRKLFCHHIRLYGTETYPLNPVHLMHTPQNIQQAGIPPVFAVACYVDSCQHDFPKTVRRKPPHLRQNIFRLTAADWPSGIRNDTVGTILAASVLNFQICPRAVRQLLYRKRLKKPFLHDIRHIALRARFCVILFYQLHNTRPVLRSDDKVYAVHIHQFLWRSLRVTAHNRNNGVFILPLYLANQLAGFFIAKIRHRTGIDDINIRRLVYAHNFIPFFRKKFGNRLAFILVHLAAQGKACRLFHKSSPFLRFLYIPVLLSPRRRCCCCRRYTAPAL